MTPPRRKWILCCLLLFLFNALMGPSGPILCVFSVGAVSIVTADSLLVPGIAARGERRTCSGVGAAERGPRVFTGNTRLCQCARQQRPCKYTATLRGDSAGGEGTFDGGSMLQPERLNLDLYVFSFSMNVYFNRLDLKRRWQILPLCCPKPLDTVYR